MPSFHVSLPLFDGPMELLLQLIERRELDVTRLALAAVTEEFLRIVAGMERDDPELLADFLAVAARLLLIKSSLLLPAVRVEEAEAVEDGEALAAVLETYRQFKGVAAHLSEREAQGLRSYARDAAPPALERRLEPQAGGLGELFAALRRVLEEKPLEPEDVNTVVRPLRITVRQRIAELRTQLRTGQPLDFDVLLGGEGSRQGVIATFLAMLEILKLGWAEVRQEGLWGAIRLFPNVAALPKEEGDAGSGAIDEYV